MKQNFNKTLAALAVAASLGFSASVYAQETTGNITGEVAVQPGVSVSDATVTIRNVRTGYTRTISVDSNGNYNFRALPTGVYTVTVNKPGYDSETVEDVRVSLGGSTQVVVPLQQDTVERIAVTGTRVSMIDTATSGTSLNIGEGEFDRIPVPRSATDVALLAPGTKSGDDRFGNYASFGGASVAENSTYINGLNVTNFRNGLGFSNVPFEFYKEFQILTGGYSAEFGRSTGGVINAVTKSGTNDFEVNANLYYEPEALREQQPDVRRSDGTLYIVNSGDERSRLEGNISVGGPIIEDKLFYYVLYNPRDVQSEAIGEEGGLFQEAQSDDAFWGAKVDWQITSDHLLELLAFSDSNTQTTDSYRINQETQARNYSSSAYEESGGKNYSVTYTGYLTDDLTVSALWGRNEYDLTTTSSVQAECNYVQDRRTNAPLGIAAGCATASDYLVEEGKDRRTAMRIDFEWYVTQDHLLRFGYDNETNESESLEGYSGPEGRFTNIWEVAPGTPLDNGSAAPASGIYVSDRVRTVQGTFETEASAFYIEDIWHITPDLTATIGIRNETFENKNAGGETFVKIDNMWAPRLGLSWDVNGDGESKAFVNVGRYFLPVMNNTNVRLSGNEFDVTTYYELAGEEIIDFNGNPTLVPQRGSQIGTPRVNADGETPDTRSIVDQDIDPMYQDEFIIGYQASINDNWNWGIRGIRRELSGAIDDMIIDYALNDRYGCDVNNQYVLGNPGEEMSVWADTNCDGSVNELITLSPEELRYPEAVRNYNAVELTFARVWDGYWSLNASYTWSQSYGNTEGLVKSDIAQEDAGITQDFDFPELMDGAYGYLPNDRRHQFKVYGSYALDDNWAVSANFLLQSGRPLNAYGIGHPGYPGEVPPYGDTYYVCNANCAADDGIAGEYAFIPRGTFGRTDWIAQLDLGVSYTTTISETDVVLRANVYNVLNAQGVTRQYEFAEEGGPGNANDQFMLPTSFQTPRYVQFSASVRF